MDLSTNYLGLQLTSPLMPGASPLTEDLDTVRTLEDAGAAAIVCPSLFEEQILSEGSRTERAAGEPLPQASRHFPRRGECRSTGPKKYLETVRKIKETVGVPVIASLNGTEAGGWIDYAHHCEQAGADALELNVYCLATDPEETGAAVEDRVVHVTRTVKRVVSIPVAVKLSPFFSSLPNLVKRLEQAGAEGVVLFNRLYQPDSSVAIPGVVSGLRLSDSSDLLLRTRWLAILTGRVDLSLAASGGVHTATDVVKALMAGAHGVQLVSVLLRRGPQHLRKILRDLTAWLERYEYASVDQIRGAMSLASEPDPAAFARNRYVQILQGGAKRDWNRNLVCS